EVPRRAGRGGIVAVRNPAALLALARPAGQRERPAAPARTLGQLALRKAAGRVTLGVAPSTVPVGGGLAGVDGSDTGRSRPAATSGVAHAPPAELSFAPV